MIRMRFEGGREVEQALMRLSLRLSRQIQVEALHQGARRVKLAARRFAPRAPGEPDLADNINQATVRGGWQRKPAVGIGPPKRFFYDTFQEFGTRHHDAQAFYRPAIDTEFERAVKEISRALWSALAARGVSRVVTQETDIEHDGRTL